MGNDYSKFNIGNLISVKISGYDIVVIGHQYYLHQPNCKCCLPVTSFFRNKRIPFKYIPFEQLSPKCKLECFYLSFWKGVFILFH